MSQLPATIPRQPELKPAEDYYRLRREGIGFIEQMGSRLWTDYNTHDPGITILEALCYAITDLAYRTGWDIKDLMAPANPPADLDDPFPNQTFFTARNILTVSPWTPDDFRRLLIDLEQVRNAWVFCKQCACDVHYYAWCEADQLMLSYQKSAQAEKVEPLGLYEVLLELEADPELGDLNDRKIEYRYDVFDSDGHPHPVILELRFPEWALEKPDEWRSLLDNKDASFIVNVLPLSLTKTDAPGLKEEQNEEQKDEYLRRYWRRVFYVNFEIEWPDTGKTMHIENAALRIFGDSFVRSQSKYADLIAILENEARARFIQRYRDKALRMEEAVKSAKTSLHQYRNLCEDYCHIKCVDVEDIAVCADVEVEPDVDIEWVQARIWFEIEQYFNPPVSFYALQELMGADTPVEEIFNGPKLQNGFIRARELEVARLKPVLRTSDIINRLMEIDGVIAVNNLLLSKYDAEGNIVKGVADPDCKNNVCDPEKISAAWLLLVSDLHQPRLYYNQSRFLFFKNGLPFLPRKDEAYDTLTQLRGEAERPKIKNALKEDLLISTGTFRNPQDYTPVQHSFPLAYGIGPDGLPSHATALRRAQAKQLKAYLMIFEQYFGNALAQIAHVADLFSLDPKVKCSYFFREFNEAVIGGYTELINGLDETALENLTETWPEFLERRNRFLDHIMARFGEQFSEYALLLTNLQGQQVALEQLIEDKIAFLKASPQISHNRGKAFNYKENPCAVDKLSGIRNRVGLLLGRPDLAFLVVEHLLLRPKFPGDALYPVCTDGPCATCGDEDPYSFRLTFVMPAWIEPFDENLTMRDFADRTIRQEIPSHLLGKICWVGKDDFERFENAWCQWLEANARFDWMEERLQERVQAILMSHLETDTAIGTAQKEKFCQYATTILAKCGVAFYGWLEDHFKAGDKYEDFKSEDFVFKCDGFDTNKNTAQIIEVLLKDRYNDYKEVSYHLWIVVNLLSGLNNDYPPATLHDCDDGSDENPVRLGQTALGRD